MLLSLANHRSFGIQIHHTGAWMHPAVIHKNKYILFGRTVALHKRRKTVCRFEPFILPAFYGFPFEEYVMLLIKLLYYHLIHYLPHQKSPNTHVMVIKPSFRIIPGADLWLKRNHSQNCQKYSNYIVYEEAKNNNKAI